MPDGMGELALNESLQLSIVGMTMFNLFVGQLYVGACAGIQEGKGFS